LEKNIKILGKRVNQENTKEGCEDEDKSILENNNKYRNESKKFLAKKIAYQIESQNKKGGLHSKNSFASKIIFY